MSHELTQEFPPDNVQRILARFDLLDARLSNLEEKINARAYDTRPIWERALQEIMETRAEMKIGFEKIDLHFESLAQKLEVLADDVLTVRARYKTLDSRVRNMESGHPQ